MMAFAPEQLANWTGGTWSGLPVRAITGFAIDSRRVSRGDCFVALKTDQRDGHDFIADAFAAGASAAIVASSVGQSGPVLQVEDPLGALQACARAHRAAFPGRVIAVTGSCGKTSTKEWLRQLLGPDETLATEGNLNNYLGVPLTLLRLDPSKHRQAVIEVGINQEGEMAPLAALIAPTDGVVTVVALAHAGGIGGLEAIAHEKAALLRAVPANGLLIFPEDCLRYVDFRELAPRATVVCSSENPAVEAEVGQTVIFETKLRGRSETRLQRQRQINRERAEEESNDRDSLEIRFPAPPPLILHLPPLSRGMRENAVLAAGVAKARGIPSALIGERASRWRPASQRGEIVSKGKKVFYVDCYNANPASMIDAIEHFSESFAGQPRLFVLGSMRELGEYAESAHAGVGARLQLAAADRAVLIGEGAPAMLKGAQSAGNPRAQIVGVAETAQAAGEVNRFEGAILLKGSRAYALERLLNELSDEGAEEEERAC